MGDATPRGEKQLIVVTRRQLIPAARGRRGIAPPGVEGVAAALPDAIASVLKTFGASMTPLFPAGRARAAAPPSADVSLAPVATPVYQRVAAHEGQLKRIAEALRAVPSVEAAYVKPAPSPAINKMVPLAAPPGLPHPSPDFAPRQDYLNVAPGGIDAHFAWGYAGGRGAGVTIVDVEGEWQLTHEDLLTNNNGVLGGTMRGDGGWRNHGTAVVGVCIGTRNTLGVTGICPDAKLGMVSIFGGQDRTSSTAIREAADKLNAGDILLIELHYPGPRHNFDERDDQHGYIAVEWFPDDFDAIQYAIGRGVIVVEAAGNGAQDLDDALYDTPDPGFPKDWKNPFKRTNRDSGAILVGAGAPPPGTHGRDLYGPDRSRLDFSNYGSGVDVQGWGREVTTCGYGDLQGGGEDRWYTDEFAGTSSASPVVVGALSCVQGICRASNAALLTSATARNLLRTTGSPQQDALGRPATQRIGNRPDLQAMIAWAAPGAAMVATS
jgi:subtilase family protein